MGRTRGGTDRRAARSVAIRRRADEKEKGGGGVGQLFVFPEGTDITFFEARRRMELDIIPYKVTQEGHPDTKDGIPAIGDIWPHRTFGVHRNVGEEEKTFVCPKMTFGDPCPICEEVAKLSKDYNANKDTIKAIKVKERQLFNIIDLDDEDKGIQLWNCSHFLFGKLLDEEIREGPEVLAEFFELQGGSTLKVRMKEGDFKTSDGKAILQASRIDFVEREDYKEDVLDETLALDELFNVPTYEELERAFLGLDDEGQAAPPEETTKEEWDKGGGRKERGRGRAEEAPPPPKEESPGERSGSRRERGTGGGRGERSSSRRERPADKAGASKCEHGGKFGVNTDEIDACDNCKAWEACIEAKDAAAAAGK